MAPIISLKTSFSMEEEAVLDAGIGVVVAGPLVYPWKIFLDVTLSGWSSAFSCSMSPLCQSLEPRIAVATVLEEGLLNPVAVLVVLGQDLVITAVVMLAEVDLIHGIGRGLQHDLVHGHHLELSHCLVGDLLLAQMQGVHTELDDLALLLPGGLVQLLDEGLAGSHILALALHIASHIFSCQLLEAVTELDLCPTRVGCLACPLQGTAKLLAGQVGHVLKNPAGHLVLARHLAGELRMRRRLSVHAAAMLSSRLHSHAGLMH